MKTMKKLAAMLLVVVMLLGTGVTVFAAGDGSEDSNGSGTSTTKSYTYEIYQIFTGDFSNGILSNVKWGQNGKYNGATVTEKDPVPAAVLGALEKVGGSNVSDREKLNTILTYADLTGTAFKSDVTGTGDTLSVENLPNGYYLVKDKSGTQNGSSTNTDTAYTTYVVQVVDNTLTIKRKADVPKVEKKITETTTNTEGDSTTTKSDANEASIGGTVNYEITGTLPSNLADYNTYFYKFTDTLSKGLTYKESSLKVEIVNKDEDGEDATPVDVTKYFYTSATEYNETTGTTITVAIQDLLALNLLTGNNAIQDEDGKDLTINITAASKIVITYSATLNEDAVIAGEGNPNKVKLTYSNDPNNSGTGATKPPTEDPKDPPKPDPTHPTGETPEDTVVTYTTELTITKVNEDGKFLPGTEFTLTGSGVNVVLVTTETFAEDVNGTYYKLKDSTYTTTVPTTTGGDDDNSADYESTTTKYSKTTTVTAKGTDKTDTDVVGEVQADGTVTFKGLGAGDYTITETKTLDGYNTITPITFKITFDAATKKFATDNKDISVGTTTNTLSTTIKNEKGSTLPSTGGIGTTVFYVLGATLVVGAGVVLVVRRRMDAEL